MGLLFKYDNYPPGGYMLQMNNLEDCTRENRPTWDEYFMFVAKVAASRSTCMSRPVGAILVLDKQILVTGYNGSMPGDCHCLDDNNCFKRTIHNEHHDKYDFCRASHAEANLLAQAAKKGIRVEGAILYTTLMPCYTCTKSVAVAGIKEVVYEHIYESADPQRDKHWREALEKRMKFRRLVISHETIDNIVQNFIFDITSRRRIPAT
jgi:dCMP deaminase